MIEVKEQPYSAVRRQLSAPVAFATVTERLDGLLGRMDLALLQKVPDYRGRKAELRERLQAMAGPSGFALFSKIDHGAIVEVLADRPTRAVTYVFGNALIAVEMTRHVPLIGLYVPPRLFVEAVESGGTRITYELPSATFAAIANAEALQVAYGLDAKIDSLVRAVLAS